MGADVKVCARCGREFFPRSNRQRWCRPCRPLVDVERRAAGGSGRRWQGFEPVQRECASCGRVFVARVPQARFCSDWCRRRAPRSWESEAARRERYDADHSRRRRVWAQLVAAGDVRCARGAECLYAVNGVAGLIHPGQPWDLGHPDGISRGGPEHRRCNRRTAAWTKQRKDGGA
jgi:hypothetical protein